MLDAQRLHETLKQAAARGRVVVTGHDAPDVDSLVSCLLVRDLAAFWHVPVQIVLPTRADGQSRRVLSRWGVDPDALRGELCPSDQLVLVDHHRTAHPGTLVACIDHHPTADPPQAPYVWITPCGACALMVLRLLEQAGVATDAHRALAVVAAYLDTLALHSPKISPEEADWARKAAARLELDVEWLTREGTNAQDIHLPPQELALMGLKTFAFGGRRVCSSMVAVMDALPEDVLQAILAVLRDELVARDAARWVFLAQEMRPARTRRWDLDARGVHARVYAGLVSRGQTVMPEVERMMMEEDGHGTDAGNPARRD